MKSLHRPDLFCWSVFDEQRNLDFNSYLWVRAAGNVVIDPLPLSTHDRQQLEQLGGAAVVVVTNSDHARDASALCAAFGAELCGPAGERDDFALPCSRWLDEGDRVVDELTTLVMRGSKTPGELALLAGAHTLITGDLIRGQRAGELNLLPREKQRDPVQARISVERLLAFHQLEAVLVGDGWPVFRDGHARLRELVARG